MSEEQDVTLVRMVRLLDGGAQEFADVHPAEVASYSRGGYAPVPAAAVETDDAAPARGKRR